MTERTNEAALWPTAHQAIMAGQSPEIPGPAPEAELAHIELQIERMIGEVLSEHRRRGRFGCRCGYSFAAPAIDDAGILAEHDAHVAEIIRQVIRRAGVVEATDVIRPACSTCEGPIRETVNMVCPTCGFDYGALRYPPASPTQPAANQEPGA